MLCPRSVSDVLSSVQDRFDRAQEHLKTVKGLLRAYYAQDPYVIYGETNVYTKDSRRVLYAERPEERLNTVIGEMLHDLRSALEHLARIFVKTNGGNTSKHFTFPARKPEWLPPANANGVRPELLPECHSDDVLRFLDDIQPYQWGSLFYADGLWILNQLSVIDRHFEIVPKHVGLTHVNWSVLGTQPAEAEWNAYTIASNEEGAELELRLKDPNPNIQGTATLQIVVDHPKLERPAAGALIFLLNDANNKTREIIDGARARFFS